MAGLSKRTSLVCIYTTANHICSILGTEATDDFLPKEVSS